MTREEFIGILVLIVAIVVLINLASKGWSSPWGMLVKIFFFPVTIAIILIGARESGKRQEKNKKYTFSSGRRIQT